jgi:hypothetical protein
MRTDSSGLRFFSSSAWAAIAASLAWASAVFAVIRTRTDLTSGMAQPSCLIAAV